MYSPACQRSLADKPVQRGDLPPPLCRRSSSTHMAMWLPTVWAKTEHDVGFGSTVISRWTQEHCGAFADSSEELKRDREKVAKRAVDDDRRIDIAHDRQCRVRECVSLGIHEFSFLRCRHIVGRTQEHLESRLEVKRHRGDGGRGPGGAIAAKHDSAPSVSDAEVNSRSSEYRGLTTADTNAQHTGPGFKTRLHDQTNGIDTLSCI